MPTPASVRAHLADVLFFRLLATCGLVHETAFSQSAEWPIVIGAICLFFMPDWLRGKDSIPGRVLVALASRQAPP